jgi:hypothetical protein
LTNFANFLEFFAKFSSSNIEKEKIKKTFGYCFRLSHPKNEKKIGKIK